MQIHSASTIQPISTVKAQAAELIRRMYEEEAPPVIVTQNGEARAVLMGIHEYEAMQETLAMLKALALSSQSIAEGKGVPAQDAFAGIRGKVHSGGQGI